MREVLRSALRWRTAALAAVAGAGAVVALALPGAGAAQPDQATAPTDTGSTTTATPPPPAGASLSTDLPCYLQDRTVKLSGSGFPAGAAYGVSEDGRALGSGTVGADGTLTGSLASGRVVAGATHLRHAITVSAAGRTASATFDVTVFGASFAPAAGNPATLVVRYSIFGFGIGPAAPKDPTPRPLYEHYIAPTGRQVALVRLGRTHGLCGSLPLTRPHHLFLFHPGPGTWHIQFDTSVRWSASSRPRVVRTVVVH